MLKKTMALLAVAAACLGLATYSAAQDAPQSPIGVKHVVWIGADGFGAHYVNWDNLPNLKKMKENGSWTLHMRSVLPSSSAINWHTMMVGAPSEMHGFRNWNSKTPEIEPIYLNEHGYFPDFFRVLKDSVPGFTATAVYNWDGIGFCFDKDAVDDPVYVTGDYDKDNKLDPRPDENVLAKALEQLATKPTFAMIYFDNPDHVGHSIGWETQEYQQKMHTIDEYVGKILAKIEELGMADDTVVLFSSDHGGSGKGHGEARLDHMEAPYIACGKGIKQGEITGAFANFDFASNVLAIFGVKQPQCWRGKVADIFEK